MQNTDGKNILKTTAQNIIQVMRETETCGIVGNRGKHCSLLQIENYGLLQSRFFIAVPLFHSTLMITKTERHSQYKLDSARTQHITDDFSKMSYMY